MADQVRRYSAASDEQLLEWSGSGDQDAFRLIVLRHGAYALRTAARFTDTLEAAEDIVQDAFVKAWTHARHFDPSRAQFTTWLYRIIVNLSLDQHRRAQTLRTTPLPADFDRADDSPIADRQIETREQRHALLQALHALPVRQQAALSLVYDEGLSGAETARRLGLSKKAVERLLARGRAFLRTRLKPDSSR
ncbi:RNA polymerase sigma factor [Acetobacter garciniae]|nr:sigma-70 family RNA polymerase sigma factor [Acetobacter garciniae]